MFSLSDKVIQHLRSLMTTPVFTGGSLGEGLEFINAVQSGTDSLIHLAPDAFAAPKADLFTSEALITALHRQNVAIHNWTINNKVDMKELIQLSADGIITDSPDLMFEALQEMGYGKR